MEEYNEVEHLIKKLEVNKRKEYYKIIEKHLIHIGI